MSSQKVRLVAGQKAHMVPNLTKFGGAQIGKFKCPKCPLAFGDEPLLTSHKIHVHHENISHSTVTLPKDMLHECEDCKATFKTFTDLMKHKKSHEAEQKGQTVEYKCEVCKRTFSKLQGLRIHIEAKHDFRCSYCGARCNNQKDLWRHYVSVHNLSVCGFCEDAYPNNEELEAHVREAHTTFACDSCDDLFITKDELKSHQYKSHGGTSYDRLDEVVYVVEDPNAAVAEVQEEVQEEPEYLVSF